jgi:kinase suppressor of Ras 2
MGACMKPPRLAIVTSMCKGYTLYTHIHVYKDKFTMNKTASLAQQISQVLYNIGVITIKLEQN